MAFPTVSRLAQLFLEKNDLPITVIRLERISDLVTDARFIQCTDKAGEVYGMEDRHGLIGRYFSYHHTKETYQRGKILSLAAKMGRPVPDVYLSHVQRPDGEILSVKKHTQRNFLSGGEVEWITFLEVVKEDPGAKPLDLENLRLTQDDLERFAGRYNVAEMEQILRDYGQFSWSHDAHIIPTSEGVPMFGQVTAADQKSRLQKTHPSSSMIQKFHQSSRKDFMDAALMDDDTLIIRRGESVVLPVSSKRGDQPFPYAYWCWHCNEIIRSKELRPNRCTRCGTYNWSEKPTDSQEDIRAEKPARQKKLPDH